MANFNPVRRLEVFRTFCTGEKRLIGVLAQNNQGVFFQYASEYQERFGHSGNLSPYKLKMDAGLQLAPSSPHFGLHGVFADSLPDGWGRLLQDRIFRQQGMPLAQITAMDRLAFVGDRGIGALSYQPDHSIKEPVELLSLAELGMQAQAVFDGQTDDVLQALVAAGSSGGARPKAQLFFALNDFQHCRTRAQENDEAWLVKFTSAHFLLGHEEGLCEAVYLQLAQKLALQPPQWRLLDAGSKRWLALKRFDLCGQGRVHLASACALLDADFRQPSLDYHDLIKMTGQLCRSPQAAKLQFRRAVFNLLASNQDDHSKNWAFLLSDDGQWQPAPFYDVTFSPHPYNEHATAFAGFGKRPPLPAMQKLATSAGYENWQAARHDMAEIADGISGFTVQAQQMDVSQSAITMIQATLNQRLQENSRLLY